jgi:biopolymer transport protein ExbB
MRCQLRRTATRTTCFLGAWLILIAFSGAAQAWWNDEWTLRKNIAIDTSSTGGSINEPIGATAPVLVRLHAGNFRFANAKQDGSDIRFVAADDKTPLKYAIEKFDSVLSEALVWVGVPDLKSGAKNEIWLYYGNPKAAAAGDAKGVYDPDTVLVYHFSQRNAPPQDSSASAAHALNSGVAADGALIGSGLRLDGTTAVAVPGLPSLAFEEGSPFTWSTWFNMTSPSPRAAIFGRREGANGLVIGLDNGIPFVTVTSPSGTQSSAPGAPVEPGGWHHLAVVTDGAQVILYLDGEPYATLDATLPALSGPLAIGSDGAIAVADPAASPDAPVQPAASVARPGFLGDIDELQISRAARSPAFIKFSAVEQGTNPGKLVSYLKEEEASSWLSGGHFGVILNSVTVDGWIVIVILAVMAVVSWFVMYDKNGYLSRQSRANSLFLKYFNQHVAELADARHVSEKAAGLPVSQFSAAERKTLNNSSLYRIFSIGAEEIERRAAKSKSPTVLSSHAMASIRAGLDSGFIKETQKLNRMMVLLTISISGGPFLGLLGTVVGVMITFAAIAASGDVNVNAIAPGIAAALVATVAGLAVAIPALFAYNYFIIRITDLTSDMQAFIDEFVSRMAEAYQPQFDDIQKEAAE